tara:strand:+ start:40229 stop:40450 length:222 start_codon:yes stop_codon:yes gene_type:complete
MPNTIGMTFTSGYSQNNTSQNNTSQNNTSQNNTSQNNTSQINNEILQFKRLRLCMNINGLMVSKPCGSCGGTR